MDDVLSEFRLFFFALTTCHFPPFTSRRESRDGWVVGVPKVRGRFRKACLAISLAFSRVLHDLTHAGCGPSQLAHFAWPPFIRWPQASSRWPGEAQLRNYTKTINQRCRLAPPPPRRDQRSCTSRPPRHNAAVHLHLHILLHSTHGHDTSLNKSLITRYPRPESKQISSCPPLVPRNGRSHAPVPAAAFALVPCSHHTSQPRQSIWRREG